MGTEVQQDEAAGEGLKAHPAVAEGASGMPVMAYQPTADARDEIGGWVPVMMAMQVHVQHLRPVSCDKCRQSYAYIIGGRAKAAANAFSRKRAKQRAGEAANRLATRHVSKSAELVPCPGCGWINRDLVRGFDRERKRRMRRYAGWALLVCLAFASVAFATDRTWHDSTFASWVAFVLAATAAGFLAASARTPWARVNKAFPAPPRKLPPRTPVAMVMKSDNSTGGMRWTPTAAAAPCLDARGRVVCAVDEMPVVAACCVCMGPLEQQVELSELAIPRAGTPDTGELPVCEECGRPALVRQRLIVVMLLISQLWFLLTTRLFRDAVGSVIATVAGFGVVLILRILLSRLAPLSLKTTHPLRDVVILRARSRQWMIMVANLVDAQAAAGFDPGKLGQTAYWS